MKKILPLVAAFVSVATVATAADFPANPMPAKVMMPAPVLFTWTGCYIGVEGGGATGQGEQIAVSNTPAFANQTITGGMRINGAMAGGTVGCNIQLSNFVVSAENDFSWTNKRGSTNDLPPFNTTDVSTTREKWLDTFRGRFGYAIDRFMVYGTAGVALAGTEVSVANPAFGTVSESRQRTGWVVGVGGEFAIWTGDFVDVTFKVEYLHAGFETHNYITPPVTLAGLTVLTRDVKLTDDIFRAGVNLKFNWGGPVVARY